jgi:hypothetical protein
MKKTLIIRLIDAQQVIKIVADWIFSRKISLVGKIMYCIGAWSLLLLLKMWNYCIFIHTRQSDLVLDYQRYSQRLSTAILLFYE